MLYLSQEDYFDYLDAGFPIEYRIEVYSRGIFSSVHFQGEISIDRKKKKCKNGNRKMIIIDRTSNKNTFIYRQKKTFIIDRK